MELVPAGNEAVQFQLDCLISSRDQFHNPIGSGFSPGLALLSAEALETSGSEERLEEERGAPTTVREVSDNDQEGHAAAVAVERHQQRAEGPQAAPAGQAHRPLVALDAPRPLRTAAQHQERTHHKQEQHLHPRPRITRRPATHPRC